MRLKLYTIDTCETVAHFVKLTKYAHCRKLAFHRVIPDFVNGGGYLINSGNEEYRNTIPCELTDCNQYHNGSVISMVLAGRNIVGTPFFKCYNRQSNRKCGRE